MTGQYITQVKAIIEKADPHGLAMKRLEIFNRMREISREHLMTTSTMHVQNADRITEIAMGQHYGFCANCGKRPARGNWHLERTGELTNWCMKCAMGKS